MSVERHQHIYDLAEVCASHGIKDVVICPGSRSAPLVLGFSNHKAFQCRVVPDERTAGFIALGLAQARKKPVILICTSGSAAYHFAPAVAEAYYQEIPLIVCTADRPLEWIGQRDGQTIQQNGIYGSHVKAFYDVQAEDQPEGHWLANRMMNEAIITCIYDSPGPVHLNFPFREPLYPAGNKKISYRKSRTIHVTKSSDGLDELTNKIIKSKLSGFNKILIVAGQYEFNSEFSSSISKIKSLPILTEILSNLHSNKTSIQHADLFLGTRTEKEKNNLKPDLLITWGQGIISRNTKAFLRSFPSKEHWHIQKNGDVVDTFKHLTTIIRCSPQWFLKEVLLKSSLNTNPNSSLKKYLSLWQQYEVGCRRQIDHVLNQSESESAAVRIILEELPERCGLHLANSMSVRHANLVGLSAKNRGVEVFSNRGTSGIDGCTSTAIGHQLVKSEPQILITGDVAFFYDSNSFWHQEKVQRMRICLINNHGGKIFKIIDGPKDREEVNTYFVGPQSKNAETFCKENRLEYSKISTKDLVQSDKARQTIRKFLKPGNQVRLLEIFAERDLDFQTLVTLKNQLKSLKK